MISFFSSIILLFISVQPFLVFNFCFIFEFAIIFVSSLYSSLLSIPRDYLVEIKVPGAIDVMFI